MRVAPDGVEIRPVSILSADDADSMAADIAKGKRPHTIFRERFDADPAGGIAFHDHLYDVMTRMGVDTAGSTGRIGHLGDDAAVYWASQANPHVFPQ